MGRFRRSRRWGLLVATASLLAAGLSLVPSAVSGQGTAPTEKPKLDVAGGIGTAYLFWRLPTADNSITKWQYSSGTSWSVVTNSNSWTDVPDSDASTRTYEVKNVTGNSACFKVRAVNDNGNGPQSDTWCTDFRSKAAGLSADPDTVTEGDSGFKTITVTVELSHNGGFAFLGGWGGLRVPV